MFAAMAAMLIVALCVPDAFGHLGLAFALALGVFRVCHIALFWLACSDDPELRHSVVGLALSTAIAVAVLALASAFDGLAQGALWALALFLDMAGLYFFGSKGWKLVAGHFAERHGLIVIIALGESIVAIGIGAAGTLDFAMGVVAVLGVGLAAALWWMYFDFVALVSARRLSETPVGKAQNELARDAFSYIHLLLVAGIVLVAFGMKSTIAHAEEHPHDVEAAALLGGVIFFLLGLVAFRLRHVGSLNRERLGLAIVLAILIPVAVQVAAWVALLGVVVLLWALIGTEKRQLADRRTELRRKNTVVHGDGH